MKRVISRAGIVVALVVFAQAVALADFPVADYSLSFDGVANQASSILGGSALPITQSSPGAADYVSIRDSESDKAFVGSDTAQPWHEGLDPFNQGSWSMLAVARGAEVVNGVYWDVGWCAWQQTNPSGWCTGFSLVRRADGTTALVRRQKDSDPQVILSARVDNDTTKFHAYIVTHNPNAAGTEESPYFVLYVDGEKVAQSTTLHQVWRNGYQFCGVYGGSVNARLSNGIAFAIDEIGIWQTELTADQAAEVSAHYPVWPNITRHEAEVLESSSFSSLGWTPPWENSKSTVGRIIAADGVCLTFDTKPTAYALEIESAGGVTLKLGENGGLDDVSTVNLIGISGELLLDATTFPLLDSWLVSEAAAVRVEDENPTIPPLSAEWYLATLNHVGQSLEIAAPLVVPKISGEACLKIGQSEGVQNIVLDEGSAIDADRLLLGANNSASVKLVQKGGDVTVRSSADALCISQYPLSDSSYTLVGGTCDASSGTVLLGIAGSSGVGCAASLVVGGGEKPATLRIGGVRSMSYRHENHTVTVKTNGTLEVGCAGFDLAGEHGRLVLEGGLVKAVASSIWRVADGIRVNGNVTIEIAQGERVAVSNIFGEGTLTKTGSGTLLLVSANPEFKGSVVVSEGTLCYFEGTNLGTGTLTVGASARLGAQVSADRLLEGGCFSMDLSSLGLFASLPNIVAFAPNGWSELVEGTDYALSIQNAIVSLAFPPRVSGHAAWLDYLFDRKGLAEHRVPSRNMRNDGYAGTSAYLLLDGSWTGETGFDQTTGMLRLKTTPCRDMTDDFAWPDRWTLAVALQLPVAQNVCLLGIGSTYFTTKNYLSLATGSSSVALKLVKGCGHALDETLAEMTLPSVAATAKHLLAITYDGNVCKVYHAAATGGVEEIGSCDLADFVPGGGLQIGSIHGGVLNTGLRRADEVSEADGCGVRAVRVYETVLGESSLQRLCDELVSQRGLHFLFR